MDPKAIFGEWGPKVVETHFKDSVIFSRGTNTASYKTEEEDKTSYYNKTVGRRGSSEDWNDASEFATPMTSRRQHDRLFPTGSRSANLSASLVKPFIAQQSLINGDRPSSIIEEDPSQRSMLAEMNSHMGGTASKSRFPSKQSKQHASKRKLFN